MTTRQFGVLVTLACFYVCALSFIEVQYQFASVNANRITNQFNWRNARGGMVGITLANEGFVGLRVLDQHRTNRLLLGWADEPNGVEPTSFVKVGLTLFPTKCQQRKTAIWH